VRLDQVLVNVVGNAIKFTERGSVSVAVRLLDPAAPSTGKVRLLVEVSDTGVGVPPDRLDAIFETFVQGSPPGRGTAEGTGLGLAISRQLVGLMGGEMWAESEVGSGSTFGFTVELGTGVRTADLPADAAPRPSRPGPLRVLLAEDNPVNQLLGQELLAQEGHEVLVVGSGREALEALARDRFDLVLMDVQMPEMDGVDAVRRIREGAAPGVPRDVPVVALTAHALHGDRERFLAAGIGRLHPQALRPRRGLPGPGPDHRRSSKVVTAPLQRPGARQAAAQLILRRGPSSAGAAAALGPGFCSNRKRLLYDYERTTPNSFRAGAFRSGRGGFWRPGPPTWRSVCHLPTTLAS
jgi:CheY-like chemotaxis protein